MVGAICAHITHTYMSKFINIQKAGLQVFVVYADLCVYVCMRVYFMSRNATVICSKENSFFNNQIGIHICMYICTIYINMGVYEFKCTKECMYIKMCRMR